MYHFKVHNAMALRTFTLLLNHRHYPPTEHVLSPKLKCCTH